MKANPFLMVIGLLLALLIGYLTFSVAEGKENDVLCGIISAVCYIATLLSTMGLQFENKRQGANVKVLSVLFFVLFAIINFCFAIFGIAQPYYIVINGILLLIFLSVLYKLSKLTDI
jgi:hypothetical protein